MADEEEGDANEMDERANQDLANVESNNSVSNSLSVTRESQEIDQTLRNVRNIPCGDPSEIRRADGPYAPRPTRRR
jgi:hypothetical protein